MKGKLAMWTHSGCCVTRAPAWALTGALMVAAVALAGCGGGGGGKAGVTTLSASSVSFNRTMSVTVNGSGLLEAGLAMRIEGPCAEVSKTAGFTDLSVQFTCRVTGVGLLIPRILDASGTELASLRLNVPLPQVTMFVRQGTGIGARSGTFVLELDPAAAPRSVTNFLDYVSAGFYTNTLFHQVEPGRLVQGGGIVSDLTQKSGLRDPITPESGNGLKNLRGSAALVRDAALNTASAQFYINLADNAEFDGVGGSLPGNAVFGRVVKGMEVVDEIGKVELVKNNASFSALPLSEVVLTLATQTK